MKSGIKKDKSTIIVSNFLQIDAVELWAKQLGKEAIRPHDKYIIIDDKVLVATADCNSSHYPAKQVYVLADVLRMSSERGKRSQEIYWV